MIEINPSSWRKPKPFAHQVVGVRALVSRPAFYLADKPRTCKSRQVVDAACVLREAGLIDLVFIIAPVAGRAVWGDKDLGQIKQYSWKRSEVVQFHAKTKTLWADEDPELRWVVTNYDFVRSPRRCEEACKALARYKSVMLVLDESAALGNHKSAQSKAVYKIRWMAPCPSCRSLDSSVDAPRKSKRTYYSCKACGKKFTDLDSKTVVSRVVMLNGSDELPPNIYSQFNILDNVLLRRHSSFTTFKWRYVEYGPAEVREKVFRNKNGREFRWRKEVSPEVGWKNLNKLSEITAPYVLRRERKDCPELRCIPVMFDVQEVALGKDTWRMYQQLKREALIEMESETYVSPNIAVRLMRLAQITSGHLGGFETVPNELERYYDMVGLEGLEDVRDLSSEKLDWLVAQLKGCGAKASIVWTRWTRERERLAEMLAKVPGLVVHQLHGGQKKPERRDAEMIFADGGKHLPPGGARHVMLAQPQAGGVALDMSAASEVYRLSRDYNLKTLEQSNDRPLGPAQRAETVYYTDVVATGPDGQRTIEHVIVAALREKRNVARMTCSEWRKELEEE